MVVATQWEGALSGRSFHSHHSQILKNMQDGFIWVQIHVTEGQRTGQHPLCMCWEHLVACLVNISAHQEAETVG